jgi:hypothetical protein
MVADPLPWSIRWANRIGECLYRCGIQPRIQIDRLRKRAQRESGIDRPDHGPLADLFPLLAQSLEEDLPLSALGRFLMNHGLQHVLGNRLAIQQALFDDPAIVERPVMSPVVVVGLPRTGTTLLHNLLSQDPLARPLLTWQSLFPAPAYRRGRRTVDQRPERVRRLIGALNRRLPKLASMHAVDADGPEECSLLLFYAGLLLLPGEAFLPRYRQRIDLLTDSELVAAYNWHRVQLQILQGPEARGHWCLKSVTHLYGVFGLLSVYPDACVVQTHRNPQQVVPSTCSLTHQFWRFLAPIPDNFGSAISELLSARLKRGLDARRHFSSQRIFDVRYEELVQQPVETVRAIYAHFGREVTHEFVHRMESWLAIHPQHKHGVHRYSLEQFGLTPEQVDRQYDFYRPYWQAPVATSAVA